MSGGFTLLPEATFLRGGVRPFYGVGPGERRGEERSGAELLFSVDADLTWSPFPHAAPHPPLLPLGVRAATAAAAKNALRFMEAA